jgi:lipopolysaccharide/colanic/teichoic acid biosynthesis glycosyltransferase
MSTVQPADAHIDGHTGHRDGDRVAPSNIPGLTNGSAHGSTNGSANGSAKNAGRLGAMGLETPAAAVATGNANSVYQWAAKRALDILFSFASLVITAPLMALLAVLIRLDSEGPVLFRQTRVGRDGKAFELVKLRTMYDGDGIRATRVGRFLRPMGLDELPQFWNVLLGHMSVVGPRPERPHLVAEYESKLLGYSGRHAVRPGITGWAQIHGLRGGAGSIAERLRFDLDYVRTWNPARDLQILARTLTAVWRDTRRELRL